MNHTILIAEPDKQTAQQLSALFKNEGFNVVLSCDGESAIKQSLNAALDIIILEIMLPKKNGFEVIQAIREHSDTPIIILTNRHATADKQMSFNYGADDFLTKPCDPNELLARIQAINKRNQSTIAQKPILKFGPIEMNTSTRTVTYDQNPLDLTKAEFNILELMIKSPGQAFSKEELTELGLGRSFTAYDRSIDVHISNLRNKLGHSSEGDEWIQTVRGFGYLLNPGSYMP